MNWPCLGFLALHAMTDASVETRPFLSSLRGTWLAEGQRLKLDGKWISAQVRQAEGRNVVAVSDAPYGSTWQAARGSIHIKVFVAASLRAEAVCTRNKGTVVRFWDSKKILLYEQQVPDLALGIDTIYSQFPFITCGSLLPRLLDWSVTVWNA